MHSMTYRGAGNESWIPNGGRAMPDYRRVFLPGGSFFFTLVAYRRRRLFEAPAARSLLHGVIAECRTARPFNLDAIVLLPNHLHTIWTLPTNDSDYSGRIGWIKKEFTKRWLDTDGSDRRVSSGKAGQRRRGVWQPRFWEHTCKDETDYEHHFDYLHYNPVKHGLVTRPREWAWSTFHRYVTLGWYPIDWCAPEGVMPIDLRRIRELPGGGGEPG